MRRRRFVAVLVATALVATAGCTGSGDEGAGPSGAATAEPWRGGTLRLAYVFDIDSAYARPLDPQKAVSWYELELFRCCLLRTLFSYNGLPASEGGAEARPDLAAGPAGVSADGLTWTIRIAPGIHYAPPLEDVEITAQDFVRALMREASPGGGAGYASYHSVIEGFDAYASGEATSITGLEVRDPHTLVVRLTEPVGDLPNRLALPGAAPIPPNPHRPDAPLGAAEGHDKSYGRFLVASGPYMIEGSQDLDLSPPPADQVPVAGYTPTRLDANWDVLTRGSLTLVRNPSWDPATDDLRGAYADRIEIQMRGEAAGASWRATRKRLARAVEVGTVDVVPDLVYTPKQVSAYRADPAMEGRLTTLPTGAISYLTLNLAVPPLDDLHVRRAIAFVIDEQQLSRKAGSNLPYEAVPAIHLAPDSLEGGLLTGYDPYPTSLERAKQEMALSRYDRNGDGLCDAPECGRVLALSRGFGRGLSSAGRAQVTASFATIDIGLRVEVSGDMYGRVSDEREKVPLSLDFGWGYIVPNASDIFQPLFASSSIPGVGGYNTSLVGASPSQLRNWGYRVTDVPSADDRIDRCMTMAGSDQTECWADLDRYLMEDVVPWIPYLAVVQTYVLSGRVATHSYSVPTGGLAIDRIALEEGSA